MTEKLIALARREKGEACQQTIDTAIACERGVEVRHRVCSGLQGVNRRARPWIAEVKVIIEALECLASLESIVSRLVFPKYGLTTFWLKGRDGQKQK